MIEFLRSSSLYYDRARYYNATMQRFISEDPLGLGGGDMNFHAYVGNDSLDFTDPFGLRRYDKACQQNRILNAIPGATLASYDFNQGGHERSA